MTKKGFFSLWLIFLSLFQSFGATDKYRCMWRDDPSTTMVIGWNQISGTQPILYFDITDFKTDVTKYSSKKAPDHTILSKGMNNHFVRLNGLKPNTTYFFVIKDSESTSKRMSFKTTPNNGDRVSIISGGDSRNQRTACQNANKMVSKLKAHCVLFGGDMTTSDSPEEWKDWLNDWQLTISSEGRLTPVVVSRGNHEQSNQSLFELFDFPNPELYNALNISGNLLRIYTLNSLIAPGGAQKVWLEKDLNNSSQYIWKFAQYHYPMVSASSQKPTQVEQILHWATLFRKYKVNLGIESDAHVAKATYPIRPSKDAGSTEHFIRDDISGTVYIGEGCWGAPLRTPNHPQPWMRMTGSFNHFNLLWVSAENVEIRTVKTDNADVVATSLQTFSLPSGIDLASDNDGKDVILISENPNIEVAQGNTKVENTPPALPTAHVSKEFDISEFSTTVSGNNILLKWKTLNEPDVIRYELQVSQDGTFFKPLVETEGKVKGRNVEGNYEYVDENAPMAKKEFSNYRLKYILNDGQYGYVDPFNESLDPKTWEFFNRLIADATNGNSVKIKYSLEQPGNVKIKLINPLNKSVYEDNLPQQKVGEYLKTIEMAMLPKGRYLLILRSHKRAIQRFLIINK